MVPGGDDLVVLCSIAVLSGRIDRRVLERPVQRVPFDEAPGALG
eukprot:CAMPEP_0194337690 /NCGR_PEP_ID=MMETSP0171-20130528/77121_1 /TAXON_ID=218684 /ORGANISM="Corethron pennatum, Strain L29A3" /LENGTH=43 /DNA_ID= /DNA_START= /DNA_END= /DNA_ORIENTATION=